MKQVKISNFFTKTNGEAVKRKRPEEEGEDPVPSSSFRKFKADNAPKKRKQSKTRGKEEKNKENGFRKLPEAFTVGMHSRKAVLSPKKLEDNVVIEKNPEDVVKDVNFDSCDSIFDEPFLDSQDDAWYLVKSELSLDRPLRCEVLRFTVAEQPRCEQVILIRAEGSEKKAICKLRDMWTFLSFGVNDIITVKAHWENGEWVVNSKVGYVVLFPDVMMPITSLVNGMYCLRRGVLNNLYKNLNQNSKQMLFGRLIHDWLQEVLKKKLDTEEEISKCLDAIIGSKSYLKEFYLNDLKVEDISSEASKFVPKITHFIGTYLKGEKAAVAGKFKGQITEVLDIEEVVASPKLGIQGRIDATVQVRTEDRRKRVMPLELKTGRASFSREHKIQVIVYTLLLSEIGRSVESGLLLYLKDGVMEEVEPDFGEVRNLLMLRNEFVKFVKDGVIHSLPEPIRSTSCSKCSHARICLSYVKHGGLNTLPLNHPIKEMDFPDLDQVHMEYFMSWTRMLFYEFKAQKETAIDNLTLDPDIKQEGDGFKHVFRTCGNTKKIEPGSFVEIGCTKQIIGRGKLLDITDTHCSVLLTNKIDNFEEFYRVVHSRSNLLHMNLTNLAYFLEEEYQHLRNLVIDLKAPNYDDKITKKVLNEDCVKVIKSLNRDQQRAIFKAVASKDYLLIRGPPGTGKTETIVALIKFLHLQNQTVLVTGHTHSSIDNILLKLKDIDYLRFGSLSYVDKKIHPRCFSRLVENCRSEEDIKRLYDCKVVASTCWGLDLDMLKRIRFDVCLIDESSQVMQVEAIRPLLFCKKFVLIGDSNQLPPVVKCAEARRLGMGVSIFERLESEASTVSLRRQYRMNKVLNNLANELTYGGCLECGSEAVAESTLRVEGLREEKEWLREVLSEDIGASIVFIDTWEYFDDKPLSKSTRTNIVEAGIIAELIKTLKKGGVREEDVGVISPFCDQIQILSRKLNSIDIQGVEVSTIDQYQGRDKSVILFSCTKVCRENADFTESSHILNDTRRITVAVTRAKVKLIILGDVKSVSGYAPMNKLISCLRDDHVIRLRNGEKGFCWDELD